MLEHQSDNAGSGDADSRKEEHDKVEVGSMAGHISDSLRKQKYFLERGWKQC